MNYIDDVHLLADDGRAYLLAGTGVEIRRYATWHSGTDYTLDDKWTVRLATLSGIDNEAEAEQLSDLISSTDLSWWYDFLERNALLENQYALLREAVSAIRKAFEAEMQQIIEHSDDQSNLSQEQASSEASELLFKELLLNIKQHTPISEVDNAPTLTDSAEPLSQSASE